MKFESLNRWLTLIANLGVLIGIIFLVVEIQQSNSIANRETATELLSLSTEMNIKVIENPEYALLRSKLRESNPTLSPMEREQGMSWAITQFNLWALVSNAYTNGLIDNGFYNGQLSGAARMIQTYPGMYDFVLEFVKGFQPTPQTAAFLRELENRYQAPER